MEIVESNTDRNNFIAQWEKTEWKSNEKEYDPNSNEILLFHKQNKFIYSIVELEFPDLEKIILPHHHHDTIIVQPSGISLLNFGKKYLNQVNDKKNDNSCLTRIRFLINDFIDNNNKKYTQGRFMYIAKNPDLGVKGHYSLPGIYCGSFHQFAAYSIWVQQFQFVPLRLFFVDTDPYAT